MKKSGVFSGGTFAVTAGQKKLTQDQKAVSTAVAASTVGSTLGDVLIRAGQSYTQVGSDLLTPAGSVDVEAQQLLVKEARATSRTDTETKQKQSGLTAGLTGGAVATIEKVQQTVDSFKQLQDASENTSSSRLKALARATAALQAKSVYDSIDQAPPPDPQQALGVSIALSIGASSSSSKSTETTDNAIGSQIVAAGTGRFVATGAGANSDLTIQGSTVQLGGQGELASDGTLNLQAAKNTASLKSTNKSGGGSVGIGIGQTTGIFVSASVGRGKANGTDETYTNTHIEAGEGLTLQSGGDVTLKGAVISADQVAGTIGGNLAIESLQDKSTYENKQMTAGVTFTYGFSGGGAGVSGNFSRSKIDSDHVSVKEQSGIRAGDGGFQLAVLGNTDLKGGAITSTESAVTGGKNTFSTAGLTMSDVDNHAEYKAKSMGFSGGSGGGGGGFGQDADDAKSVTRAGISGYAGNMVARTGDAESGIPKIFDVNKVQREIDAQVTITRAFGQVAPKAVADFADRQTQRYSNAKLAKEGLEAELANETDPVRRAQLEQARDEASQYLIANQNDYDKWREGGVYRVALHAALGGLSGGYSGALGAGAAASAAPAFNELQDRLARSLANVGANDNTASGIARFITGVTAAGVGGVLTGGDFAGSGQALNVDSNNRQLHEEEIARIKKLAKGDKKKEDRLTAAACALVKCYAEYPEDSDAYRTLKSYADAGASPALAEERALLEKQAGLFEYTTVGFFNDQRTDTVRQLNNTYQVTTRTLGTAQAVIGGLDVAATVVAAPAACATGVGCFAVGAMATLGADNFIAGAQTAVTGVPQSTLLNQALQAAGFSENAATYLEIGTNAAATIGVGRAVLAASNPAVSAAAINVDELVEKTAKSLSAEELKTVEKQAEKLDAPASQGPAASKIEEDVAAAQASSLSEVKKVGRSDADQLGRSETHLDHAAASQLDAVASPLLGAERAIIDPRKLAEYALNPAHPVGGNKAKVFESALGFTRDNADNLMMQLRQGVTNNPAVAGKVDQFGARFTVDIPVTGPAGSGVVRSGWIYKGNSDRPELTTIFVK